jgi:hypothetical protein
MLAVATCAAELQATLFLRFRPNRHEQLHSHGIFMKRGPSKQDVQSSKVLVICLAMQKDRRPLRPVLRLSCPLLTCFQSKEDSLRKKHSCAAFHQSCLGIAKGPQAVQNATMQAWQQVSIAC